MQNGAYGSEDRRELRVIHEQQNVILPFFCETSISTRFTTSSPRRRRRDCRRNSERRRPGRVAHVMPASSHAGMCHGWSSTSPGASRRSMQMRTHTTEAREAAVLNSRRRRQPNRKRSGLPVCGFRRPARRSFASGCSRRWQSGDRSGLLRNVDISDTGRGQEAGRA